MKFLAVIPARYASTRFPGKPLAQLFGKPMIRHVYEKAARVFDICYVATDNANIAQTVMSFGGKCVMTREDHQSGTDRCYEALTKIEAETAQRFDVVVNIQGDEPFLDTAQLVQLIHCFEDERTEIATLIKPFSAEEDISNPNTPKVVVGTKGQALYFSRSPIPFVRGKEKNEWNGSHLFYKHIGLYAYRSHILAQITSLKPGILETAESLEQLRWLENGFAIQTAVTDKQSFSIDTPEELKEAIAFFSTCPSVL